MEFGIFIFNYLGRRGEADPDAEHTAMMKEIEIAKAADASGWKYVWLSEHHFLPQYSHMSDSAAQLGYLAAVTNRIHIGSGIFNLNPNVNHPARIAERVATLDHLSEGRFEFGTGRGAGSREVTGFDIATTAETKANWDEVIHELPKMWREHEYSHQGQAFTMPHPESKFATRDVLPKPWKGSHPAMWVAAGNPPTYEKAARMGLGVLGFNAFALSEAQALVDAYKNGIKNAEPVGDYVNDNVMICTAFSIDEDAAKARQKVIDSRVGFAQSLVFRYHDTFAHPEGIPEWPALIPDPTPDDIEWRIKEGYLNVGDPDEIVEQMKRFESMGVDQVVMALGTEMPYEEAMEGVRLFGEYVIPKFDKDPVHSTTRYRQAAQQR